MQQREQRGVHSSYSTRSRHNTQPAFCRKTACLQQREERRVHATRQPHHVSVACTAAATGQGECTQIIAARHMGLNAREWSVWGQPHQRFGSLHGSSRAALVCWRSVLFIFDSSTCSGTCKGPMQQHKQQQGVTLAAPVTPSAEAWAGGQETSSGHT